jgi:carboxypeptidase family protein
MNMPMNNYSFRCWDRMVLSLLSALFIFTTAAPGQSTSTGTVSGQAMDPQNAAVAGVAITLLDVATNTSRMTQTNDEGRYSFVNVPPGIYDITANRTGFARAKLPAQKVTVGLVLTANFRLQVGSVSDDIVVTSSAGADLQTTNSTVGASLSGRHLEMLTNLGRDANALFVLQPAVSPTGDVAGAVRDQNTYQLDGGNNSSDMDGAQTVYTQSAGFIGAGASGGTPSGVMPTPAESIEEFKVGTNNQTADFNGSAGGQVQMVTKRGTNEWHGAVYEHYLGSNFGANSWSNNRTNRPKPSSHQNRFGAAAGGPITPHFWGGKTYFFANYEGRRFPQSTTVNRAVPSDLMRAGVIQVQNSTGVYQAYNLNPFPVTVNGVTYQPATCGAANDQPCDPRGIGLSQVVSQLWSTSMPRANDLGCTGLQSAVCDQRNTQGFLSTIRLPQNSDFLVARIDHDFGTKWHFMSSYRYFNFSQLANTQIDIGGMLPGSTLGQAVSTAPRVQKPWYYVAGLTTNISQNLTNDFHYNYLRNYWEWGTAGAPPQLPGLGGALEIGGENANALIPYNVNTQNVRRRFWDGQDHAFRDDLTLVHGNHLFQFGGMYQRNLLYHLRNDNGQGIMAANVYQIANNPGLSFTAGAVNYIPSSVPANQASNWQTLYTEVLGIVGQPQSLYTRQLPDFSLEPLGTPASDKSIVPTYNVYYSDTWRMRPSLTLTYGLGYTIQMPPYEVDGKQVMLVDSAGQPIISEDYLAKRKEAALAGQVYNPTLGFATIHNVTGDRKYPYDPFYGGLSPRLAVAWNPKFNKGLLGKVFGEGRSVIRGGYSRIYGRLNGVNLVLVPLLGTGLMQAVSCQGAVNAANAINGNQCLGSAGANPLTAFRIGTDGMVAPLPSASQTLAQPYYPGIAGNASAGDGSSLDPKLKPNYSDQFDFTIQRELVPRKILVEVGYIGRRIRNEYQAVNLDAVPYMTTLNGQSFANAFANLYLAVSSGQAVQPQPWFEAALGGANSAFCAASASCTAAVAANQNSNIASTRVYDMWASLSRLSSWTLGRTMPSSSPGSQLTSIYMETSLGYSNYHAGFTALEIRDWNGLTARSNFTWSKALGTGAVTQATSQLTVSDPWDIDAMYGPQEFDIRFLYNLSVIYEPSFFKGRKGIVGQLLGGWSFAPLFTARSGAPLRVNMSQGAGTNCQSFGEVNCSAGSTWENAVLIAPYTGGNSAHKNLKVNGSIGSNTNAANGGSSINLFENPAEAYGQFRRLILGVDHTSGGFGVLRGLPAWNVDLSISKDIKLTERTGLTFLAQFANVFNHFQPGDDASLNLDQPQNFGHINSQSNTILSRQIEFGLRFRF